MESKAEPESKTRRSGLRSRGRSKGYTTRSGRPEKFFKERDKPIAVIGVVGTATNLYAKIDAILQRKGWNWSTLSERAEYSRWNIVKRTARDSVSQEFILLLCSVLDVPVTELMDPEESKA